MKSLFKHDPFTAHSGKALEVKVECDALTDDDWVGLARIASILVGPFSRAVGVPRGGIPFAEALNEYATGNDIEPVLICDDVLTTGGSMVEFRDREFPEQDVKGVVAFARDRKALYDMSPWVRAVWIASVEVP